MLLENPWIPEFRSSLWANQFLFWEEERSDFEWLALARLTGTCVTWCEDWLLISQPRWHVVSAYCVLWPGDWVRVSQALSSGRARSLILPVLSCPLSVSSSPHLHPCYISCRLLQLVDPPHTPFVFIDFFLLRLLSHHLMASEREEEVNINEHVTTSNWTWTILLCYGFPAWNII